MEFHLRFTQQAFRQLKKTEEHTAALILGCLRKKLEGCSNPRHFGKALSNDHSGKWRYPIGEYRILAHLQDKDGTILILGIGHRKEVYH